MNNQQAFPISGSQYKHTQGMTLRDYFAAKAMQGILAGMIGYGADVVWEHVAREAYMQADAMLKAMEA